jgi:hypothetical protein
MNFSYFLVDFIGAWLETSQPSTICVCNYTLTASILNMQPSIRRKEYLTLMHTGVVVTHQKTSKSKKTQLQIDNARSHLKRAISLCPLRQKQVLHIFCPEL